MDPNDGHEMDVPPVLEPTWGALLWDTVKLGATGLAVCLVAMLLCAYALMAALFHGLTWLVLKDLFWMFLV
ncbi:hypothetical protein [Pseudomonas sp. NPDC007930]|uniref:hypothetical protein n=1 Tax=Pseudomonas sp. NPDC007930 TaxID=3364417 RepID=UPI0036EC0EE9